MSQPRTRNQSRTMYGPAPSAKQYGEDRRCVICNGKLSKYNPQDVCVLHQNVFRPEVEETERKCATCRLTKPIAEYKGHKNQLCKTCESCRVLNRQAKAEKVANGYKRVRRRNRALDRLQTAPPGPAARSQGNPQPAAKKAAEGS